MNSNFEVEKELFIEELHCRMTLLRHKGCGARVLHLGNDDPENVFCLGFQTLPTRSDGVPHILEHTVLCGSKKYTVKDPFFSMLRRSLNTFMNAMTGDDMTFYPAASQVRKDFYNLLDVYLDAVFFPHLRKKSFLQEGHRLEFEGEKLTYKGIVFNEMKGAMASPDARAWHRLAEALYPDTPYRFNSGGDPAVIPELTYEELRSFHEQFYSPSRCIFYFYGDIPLDDHLEFLEEQLLKDAERLDPLPPVPRQPRFTQSVRVVDTYPSAAGEPCEDKAMVLMAWLTCTPADQLEMLALQVLDIALMGSDAAPLKLALLQSGLCKEADCYIDPDAADVPVILMLKGCNGDDADKIEALVSDELAKIAQEGLPQHLVEAALHQLEFGRTEILGDSAPFGLVLFRRTVPLLLAGANPEDGLKIHSLFDQLRDQLDPRALIQKYFLDNPHLCRLTMSPDPQQAEDEAAAERATLDAIAAALAPEEKEAINKSAQELAEFQADQEKCDLDVLPKVTLADVPKEARQFPLTSAHTSGVDIHIHECFTNGIVDAALVFDMPQLEPADLPYVRLFLACLPEVGCGGRDYKENLEYVQLYAADVAAGVATYPLADDPKTIRPAINIEGKTLHRNAGRLLPLLCDMVTSADFTDRQRLSELLMQHYSSLEHGLVHNAMRYATNLAAAAFTEAGAIANQWHGLEHLHFMRQLMSNDHLDHLIEKFGQLQTQLLGLEGAQLVISGEEVPSLPDLPAHPFQPWQGLDGLPTIESQGRIIAAPVAFTCRMLETIPYTHTDSPLLALAARLFNHTVLHKEIREIGGAYGGGARANVGTGTFHFYCYRDPHLKHSISAMDTAVAKIAAGDFDAAELEEAQLTILQKLDTPVSPGSRAWVTWVREREGRTLEARQQFRDRLLSATPQEVTRAVQEHLQPQMAQATLVSFAGQDLFDREGLDLRLFPA